MRILNLYAGIGGNRKLWGGEHEITAVEYDEATAEVYKSYFPNDTVLIEDAHEYLLNHYKEFDFIWSSPPCPTHSRIRMMASKAGDYRPEFPDMTLYQQIIFMQHFCNKILFCVENVIPYYEPIIQPTTKLHRHLYWSNFTITNIDIVKDRIHNKVQDNDVLYGFNVSNSTIKDKRKALRNMVNPELGLHILNCAMGVKTRNQKQDVLFEEFL